MADSTDNKANDIQDKQKSWPLAEILQASSRPSFSQNLRTPFNNPHAQLADQAAEHVTAYQVPPQATRNASLQDFIGSNGLNGMPYYLNGLPGYSLNGNAYQLGLSDYDRFLFYGYLQQPPQQYHQPGFLNSTNLHSHNLGQSGSFAALPKNVSRTAGSGPLLPQQSHIHTPFPRVFDDFEAAPQMNRPDSVQAQSIPPSELGLERELTPVLNKSTGGRGAGKKKVATRKSEAKFADDNDADQPAQVPPASPGAPVQLFFQNRAQAVAAMKVPDWSPPHPDGSIPTSDQERQEWVRKLVGAFLDITRFNDKDGPVLLNRWVDQSNSTRVYKDFYDRQAMEKLCWDILDVAERLHREGPQVFTSLYDPNFEKAIKKTRELTFAERMNRLVTLFTKYKARCDKVFKGSVIETFVADPGTMLGTAAMNRNANDHRQGWIRTGRDLTKGQAQATPSPPPQFTPMPDNAALALAGLVGGASEVIDDSLLPASLGDDFDIAQFESPGQQVDGDENDEISFINDSLLSGPSKRKVTETDTNDENVKEPPEKRVRESSPLSDPPSSSELKSPPNTRTTL